MSEQYTHLLIPDRMDFVPRPEQVAAFLIALESVGGAPIRGALRVGKLSGKVRVGSDSLTGERISIPGRDFVPLAAFPELPMHLGDLDDYDVVLSGEGPPTLPPFALYTIENSQQIEYREAYGYDVLCRLRRDAVSTCDVPPFGSPCQSAGQPGIFHNPVSGARLEVPNAACARFWIEFEFGKWLVPRISTNLDLLQPAILRNALSSFGTGFAQGCVCL